MEILFVNRDEGLGFLVLDGKEMARKIEESMKEEGMESSIIPYSIGGKTVSMVPIIRLSSFPEIPYVLWDNPIIGEEDGRIFHITSILRGRYDERRSNYLTFEDKEK